MMKNRLVLKHQNGKITEYEPISFNYVIRRLDQSDYYGCETESVSGVPIRQLRQICSFHSLEKQFEVNEITCKMLPDKHYTDYTELINMMVWKEKASVMCDGELTMMDGTNATLHNCIVTSKVDNKITFQFDFIHLQVGGK